MIIGVATAVLMIGLVGAALVEGLAVADAVADPEETAGYRLLGIVSNVGLLLLASVVAICVFGGLLFDDFLPVHEFGDDVVASVVDFDPTRGRKNVIESAVFASYGIVALGCGWLFRSQLRQLDYRPLLIAAALFGSSSVVHMRLHRVLGVRLSDGSDGPDLRSILEEGPKLMAIASSVVFVGLAGRRAIESSRAVAEAGGR